MGSKNYGFSNALEHRARRSGCTGLGTSKSRTRSAAKRTMSRIVRKDAKQSISVEVLALSQAPSVEEQIDRLLESGADWSAYDLDAMADQLLEADAEQCNCEDCQAERQRDEDSDRPLPIELQLGLPDWMLEKLERANGDSFEYLSLLEEKRRPSTFGLLAEEEREIA